MKPSKRVLSLILSSAMILSLSITPAFAAAPAIPLPEFGPQPPIATKLYAVVDQVEQLRGNTEVAFPENTAQDFYTGDYWALETTMLTLEEAAMEAAEVVNAVSDMYYMDGPAVSQEEVDEATSSLKAALKEFQANRYAGVLPSPAARTKLKETLVKANDLMVRHDDIRLVVADTGDDVDIGTKWVSGIERGQFQMTIREARRALSAGDAGQVAYEDITRELEQAMNRYRDAWQDGQRPSVSGIYAQMQLGDLLGIDLAISEDGKDIPSNEYWFTAEQRKAYIAVRQQARNILANFNQGFYPPKEMIDAATTSLTAATKTLADQRKPGFATPKPGRTAYVKARQEAYALWHETEMRLDGDDITSGGIWATEEVLLWFENSVVYLSLEEDVNALDDEEWQQWADQVRLANDHFKAYRYGKGNTSTTPGEEPEEENAANTPETLDKINSAADSLKNPTAQLPKGAQTVATPDGKSMIAIPIKLTSGASTLNKELMETLGSNAGVALKLSVSHSIQDSVEILLPGGFGKVTESGRFGYPMHYSPTAPNEKTLLAAAKGEAKNHTVQIGGCFKLPSPVTVTVKTSIPEGSAVNVYRYDPQARLFTLAGTGVVKGGKLQFATQLMGELLFTTEAIG